MKVISRALLMVLCSSKRKSNVTENSATFVVMVVPIVGTGGMTCGCDDAFWRQIFGSKELSGFLCRRRCWPVDLLRSDLEMMA